MTPPPPPPSGHPPDPERIVRMASAFYESGVLFAASDLGLFKALAETGQETATGLARRLNLSARGVRLLADACVALGLLVKQGYRYQLTPPACAFLVPGSPGDLSATLRYNRDVYTAWGKLPELVRTGRPVESPHLHLGDDPARTRTFVMAMHAKALGIGRAVVPQLDLAGCRSLLDIGGGPGTYAALIAKANPAIRCTVIDLPAVAAIAGELIAAARLTDRVSVLPGDYHDVAFPGNNDAITIFGALHQESAQAIRDILRRAHAALAPGGRILVMDLMTDATHTAPAFSALFAVNMALTTEHGWVFSDKQLEGWLIEAGFSGFTCRPLAPPMPHWLATARKAGGPR